MLVPRTNFLIFADFCKIFSFPFPPLNTPPLSLQLHWGVLSLPSLPPFSLLVKLGLHRIWRNCSWPLDICTYYVYVIRIRILICLKLAFRRTLLRSVSSKDQFQGEVLPLASPLFKGLRPKRKKRSVRNERCVFAVVEAVRNLILICCTYIFYVYFSEKDSKILWPTAQSKSSYGIHSPNLPSLKRELSTTTSKSLSSVKVIFAGTNIRGSSFFFRSSTIAKP